MNRRTTISSALALSLLAGGAVVVMIVNAPSDIEASERPDSIRLPGTVHDFRAEHPDFRILDGDLRGHFAGNIETSLGGDQRPIFSGSGRKVDQQWYDRHGNPIRPYFLGDDPGLPGGHFDVDVFDEATDKELYHQHQYDDKFDVTYVDLVHDARLLLDEVLPATYPNGLRVEFFNPHHGSGSYVFEAGSGVQTGLTRDGFSATFDRSELTQLRINFASLMDLRGTKPGTVQGDVVNRDDALSIRMYDVTTGTLVYELAIYHHTSGDDHEHDGPGSADACGNPISDLPGRFGGGGPGAVDDPDTFSQWYRDVLGTNLSKPFTLTLFRNDDVYEFLTNDFYPVDEDLFGNDGDRHNFYFTHDFSATFVYRACTGQFFEFEGNDDAWVFIDDQLVIDLGGVATPERQYVALDRLGLVDGETYPLHFFFAHRAPALESVFRLRTNLLLTGREIRPVTGGYD